MTSRQRVQCVLQGGRPVPTPTGPVKVSHRRNRRGPIETNIEKPDAITIA